MSFLINESPDFLFSKLYIPENIKIMNLNIS